MSEQSPLSDVHLIKPHLLRKMALNMRAQWPYFVAIILIFLCVFQWWNTYRQIRLVRQEFTQRLQSEKVMNHEIQELAKTLQENIKVLQDKTIVLESKQLETQNKQIALDQLYQDFSKNREDWALAEMEQVLSTASGQLQLSGNVSGALTALQNIDNRLLHSDRAQFIAIRRAIAKDIEKLKSLQNFDLTGIALRLDSVLAQLDSVPLLSDAKPLSSSVKPKTYRFFKNNQAAKSEPDWLSNIQDRAQSFFIELWAEVQQLIRVTQVDTSEALFMSPTQGYYVRENVKLRLLNARLALLSRNETAFRNDMIAAQEAIARYFDTRAKQTQTVQLLLRQIQNGNVSIEAPILVESLNAIRSYRVRP